MQQKPASLARPGQPTLAYLAQDGRGPTVVFFSGFMSDMVGKKAEALAAFCRDRGQAMLRFDYRAHGLSEGVFAEAGLEDWLADALAVIDAATTGPLLFVGSSMGGWLMLLAAQARRERVVGIVGIAAAPDFTEELIWSELSFEARERLMRDGAMVQATSYSEEPYLITRKLIEDGRRMLLLGGPIELACPVHLLHGMNDGDVPYELSLRIAERLTGSEVAVTLVKDGDHRLSREPDLALILGAVALLSSKAGF
ncbi:MAG TPA: alpha/beta hydrolase [Alphaproteobacteria bacterium]